MQSCDLCSKANSLFENHILDLQYHNMIVRILLKCNKKDFHLTLSEVQLHTSSLPHRELQFSHTLKYQTSAFSLRFMVR